MAGTLLAACGSPTSAPTATNLPPTASLPPIPPSPSLTVSPTFSPTPSPTPTPVSVPERFDLPGWLADPATPVLMLSESDMSDPPNFHPLPLRFFNGATGEDYRLPIENVLVAFWLPDGSGFGFGLAGARDPHNPSSVFDFDTVYVVSLPDGVMISYKLGQFALSNSHLLFPGELGYYLGPTLATASSNDPGSETFFLYSVSGIAPDRRHILYNEVREYFEVKQTLVGDLFSPGEELALTDLDDEWIDLYAGWSPVGLQVLVLQDTALHGRGRSPCECVLRIYDAATGEEIAFYEGSVGYEDRYPDMAWSPDGTRIAFIRPEASGGWGGQPCVWWVGSAEAECFDHGGAAFGWDYLAALRWLPDGQHLSYLLYNDDGSSEAYATGGVCLLDLASGAVTCPARTQPGTPWVRSYGFSVDGEWLWFRNGCYSCDHDSGPDLFAVMRVDGSGYREIGGAGTIGATRSRPAPPAP